MRRAKGPADVAAVRLSTAEAQVWIATGRAATWPPSGEFHLYNDDVLVVSDTVIAE